MHSDSRKIYGSPRIHRQLKPEGVDVSLNRVARLMRSAGIHSKTKRLYRPRTTDSKQTLPLANNLLNQAFKADQPNQKWVGDIRYIPTKQGGLLLAVILDLFSRKVGGWSMDVTMKKEWVIEALQSAIKERKPLRGLLFHSDRRSQYASAHYQEKLQNHGIIASMRRKGDCYDHAVAESLFHTLKTEYVHFEKFQNPKEAQLGIFEYSEGFYNRKRIHSSINFQSPMEFEKSQLAGLLLT